MQRKIGVAALVAVLAAGAMVPTAYGQATCGGGLMIDFNNSNVYAYETNVTADLQGGVGVYKSNVNSILSVVGIVHTPSISGGGFCPPMPAIDLAKEYTVYFTGLKTTAGTQTSTFLVTGTRYDTDYDGGTFEIWEDASPDCPLTNAAFAANAPGGGVVPDNFRDAAPASSATLILSGTLTCFHVTMTRSTNTSAAGFAGNFTGIYSATGGSAAGAVTSSPGMITGTWCGKIGGGSTCTPTGYTAHPAGKFDAPSGATCATNVLPPHSWGKVKSIYR